MKFSIIAPVLSLAAGLCGLASAKDCPVESACMQKMCSNFAINRNVKTGDPKDEVGLSGGQIALEAHCKDRWGTDVYSWLDLRHCLANIKGNMAWAYQGNTNCIGCRVLDRRSNDEPVVMSCTCLGGGRTPSENVKVNLSEGIWVYDGVLGCYHEDGHKIPIRPVDPPKVRRATPPPPSRGSKSDSPPVIFPPPPPSHDSRPDPPPVIFPPPALRNSRPGMRFPGPVEPPAS